MKGDKLSHCSQCMRKIIYCESTIIMFQLSVLKSTTRALGIQLCINSYQAVFDRIPAVGLLDGRIYAIGGRKEKDIDLKSTEVYEPIINSQKNGSSLDLGLVQQLSVWKEQNEVEQICKHQFSSLRIIHQLILNKPSVIL